MKKIFLQDIYFSSSFELISVLKSLSSSHEIKPIR